MTFLRLNCVRVVCDRTELSDNYNWKSVHIVLERGMQVCISLFCTTGGKQNIFDAGKLYKTPDRDCCYSHRGNICSNRSDHRGYLWPKNMIELSVVPVASLLWHWLEFSDTDAEAETWSFILPDHSIYLMFMCLYRLNYARTLFFCWLYHWNSRRSP